MFRIQKKNLFDFSVIFFFNFIKNILKIESNCEHMMEWINET